MISLVQVHNKFFGSSNCVLLYVSTKHQTDETQSWYYYNPTQNWKLAWSNVGEMTYQSTSDVLHDKKGMTWMTNYNSVKD